MNRILGKSLLGQNKGNAWVGLLILLIFVISLGLALTTEIINTIAQSKRAEQVIVAQALCDAGIEKAVWKTNQTNGGYNGEADLNLETGIIDITIDPIDGQNKYATATAYVPDKEHTKVTRTVRAKITALPNSENVSFHYAIQAGTGGINVSGSSEIEGSLYSNGDINFSGAGYEVTGDASAHNAVSPNPNTRVHGTITEGVPEVPLPEINIDSWKELAAQGGVIAGSYVPPSGTTNLGPKKITGSFSMSSAQQKIKLTGPLYIQGAANISGGEFILDDSLGSSGTIVIVDGPISISGGAKFTQNSGGGYILFLSTYEVGNAISYSGSSSSEALAVYAYYAGLTLSGSGEIVALCGETLSISGSGEIKYKSGLAGANFSAGPGGSWQIKEWQIKNP